MEKQSHGLKRKLDEERGCVGGESPVQVHMRDIQAQVDILDSVFSASEHDRSSAKNAIHALSELAKNEEMVNLIVDCAAVPVLVKHLQAPSPLVRDGEGGSRSYEHEVEKGSAFTLALLAIKVHIDQRGAVPPLIEMLQSPDVQLREMSAFALGRLAQDDPHNQAVIAQSGGITPLLKLLESKNGSLQHNAAFALYGLADNEDNVADIISVGGGVFRNFKMATRDCVAKTLKRLGEKIHGQVLSHLSYLMREGEENVQRRVALALAHLCPPDNNGASFADLNEDFWPKASDLTGCSWADDETRSTS